MLITEEQARAMLQEISLTKSSVIEDKETIIRQWKDAGLIEMSQLDWAKYYVCKAKELQNVYYAMKAIEIYKLEIERLQNESSYSRQTDRNS